MSNFGSELWGNISDMSLVENVAKEGQCSDEDCKIVKFIQGVERDIAAKSTEQVKDRLSRDKTSNQYKRRENILVYYRWKGLHSMSERETGKAIK